jgi:hypothetical protein
MPPDYGGQSLRAGSATWLAQLGTESSIIQASGWWKSNTWNSFRVSMDYYSSINFNSLEDLHLTTSTAAPGFNQGMLTYLFQLFLLHSLNLFIHLFIFFPLSPVKKNNIYSSH